MINNSGPGITEHNDLRITYIGKILRMTKLDELPQLLNILFGDMRFIGPRPEIIEYFDESQFLFLENKTGISDFSSIIFRNEEKILHRIEDNPYKELLPIKIKLTSYYSKNKGFFLDLYLVLLTIISIFSEIFN